MTGGARPLLRMRRGFVRGAEGCHVSLEQQTRLNQLMLKSPWLPVPWASVLAGRAL